MKSLLISSLLLTSSVLAQGLTVNKFAYTLDGKSIDNTNKLGPGTGFQYVVNVSSSDGSLGNAVTIEDDLPSGFLLASVTCTGTAGALCPAGGASETLSVTGDPIVMSGFSIPLGGTIKLVIAGSFAAAREYANSVKAYRKAGGPMSPGSHSLKIDPIPLPLDIELVEKKATPTTGALGINSLTGATVIDYSITVKNNGPADAYLGGLKLTDRIQVGNLSDNISYEYSAFACSGTACPNLPGTLAGTLFQSYQAAFNMIWPATAVLKQGESFTVTFKARYGTKFDCGTSGSVKVTNEAFLALSSATFSLSDMDASNNTKSANVDLTYKVASCPPPPGVIIKRQLSPVLPAEAPWDDEAGAPEEVVYEITATNNQSTAVAPFLLDDYLSPFINTPAFTAIVAKPTCTPNCDDFLDPNTSINFPRSVDVDNQGKLLFRAKLNSLAPGATVTITFRVRYLATCLGSASGKISIRNTASGGGFSSFFVDTPMKDLDPCQLRVEKEQIDANGQVITNGRLEIGQPVRYRVRYINPKGQATVVLRNVRDAMAITAPASNNFGTLPIKYGPRGCSVKGTVQFSVNQALENALANISYQTVPSNGTVAIWEPTTGIRFVRDTTQDTVLECVFEFTPGMPTGCHGRDDGVLTNLAYMDTVFFNQNFTNPPFAHARVDMKLPACRTVTVQKDPNPEQVSPGGTVTYTVKVLNNNPNDPVADIEITDSIPAGFQFVSSTCAGCSGTPTYNSTTGVLTAQIASIPKGGQTAIQIVLTAPSIGGTYENIAEAKFTTDGKYFYTPGGKPVDNAQVQVLTPTLSKQFKESTIGFGQETTLTWTITDQPGNAGQQNLAFSDLLPAGLTVLGPPVTTCRNITANAAANGQGAWLVNVSGNLLPREGSCTITVRVVTKACGKYVNDKGRIREVRYLDPTGVNAVLDVTGCPPSLTINKVLTGAPKDYRAEFVFDVVCATPSGQTLQKQLTIQWPAMQSITLPDLPPGTTCTVVESKRPPSAPAGYDWTGVPIYSPATGVIKIGEAGAVNAVTVTNAMRPCIDEGEVKITKRLEGVPPGFQGTFKFTVNCWLGTQLITKQAQITLPGASTILVPGIPMGGTCTVTETGPLPALPANWQWSAPVYSPGNGQVDMRDLCCQTVVVTNRAKYCCRVESIRDYTDTTTGDGPARSGQRGRANVSPSRSPRKP
jgi:uncharacterized repeat protein (TIGR01451 family)